MRVLAEPPRSATPARKIVASDVIGERLLLQCGSQVGVDVEEDHVGHLRRRRCFHLDHILRTAYRYLSLVAGDFGDLVVDVKVGRLNWREFERVSLNEALPDLVAVEDMVHK